MNTLSAYIAFLAVIMACLSVSQPSLAADIKGSVTTQWLHFPDSEPENHSFGRSVTLELEAYHRFDSNVEFVGDGILRMDDKDAGRRRLDAKEAYLKTTYADTDFFIGNRQVFWGKAESRNIVDVINQRDTAANTGQTEKIGASSLSAEGFIADAEWQVFYLPAFTEQTSHDPDAHPSAGLRSAAALFSRKDGKDADDFAARISSYSGNWDYALSGFYGTAREPLRSVTSAGLLQPRYVLQRSVGLEGQYTSDEVLVKLEGLAGVQGSSDFSALVTGIEKTFYAVGSTKWDAGLISELQFDDRPQAADELFGVIGVRLTLNDTQDTSLLMLYSSDREHDQTLTSLEASRRLTDAVSLVVNASFFNARTPSSSFGMLSDDDQLSAQLKWFF